MQYRVRFTGDDDLPTGVDWVIVAETPDGLGPFLFVRESAVGAELFSEAWTAWESRRAYSSSSSLPAASNA
jgi:hypothetical protein